MTETTAMHALGPLHSEEEAQAWVIELIEECERVRQQIDWATMVREQRALFCRWMILRGQAHGVISALKRCQRISDECHNQLRERVLATAHPTLMRQAIPFSSQDDAEQARVYRSK